MSIIYRPHCGGFAQAMKNAKVFDTADEMKEYIAAEHEIDGVRLFETEDVVINDDPEWTYNDPRNGWQDTKYVCVKRIGSQIYSTPQCIGFCATVFPEP